ncbi:MAG: hypothetical protein R6U46_04255 [Marinilabilia sp.]
MTKYKTILLLTALLSCLTLLAQHDWSYTPSDYELTHTITGQVYINGEIASGENLQLGAFAGSECRGSIMSSEDSEGSHSMFYLTMHAHQTESDEMTFVLKNQEGEETWLVNTVLFVADGIACSPDEPFLWMDEVLYASTDFLEFSVLENDGEAKIDTDTKSIELELDNEEDLSVLTPEFEMAPGAIAFIGDEKQNSGRNILDFTSTVSYTIKGVDGTLSEWKVTITNPDESFSLKENNSPVVYPTITNKNIINIELKQAAWYEIYSADGILVKSGALFNGKNQVVINNKGILIYKVFKKNSLFLSGKLLMY